MPRKAMKTNLGKETEYIEHKKSTSELREGVVSVCASHLPYD